MNARPSVPLPVPGPAAIARDPHFARLKSFIIQRTGLAYYADKDLALAERINRRLTDRGQADLGAYHRALADESVRGTEMQALINELCVGETFFFRYVEQFEALRVVAVPECLRRNAETRTLRIWSAGCSIGAEAYTLEILLKRHFAAELDGWRVLILGTDINRAFLDQARRGVYGDWSLRGLPAALQKDCFDSAGNGWSVKPAFRAWTRFDMVNLVEDTLPDFSRGIAGFDIILCRNVMIYFDEPTRHRLIGNLRDSLLDGGWLVVGHAETGAEMNAAFTPVPVPGATLYRKPDPLAARRPPPPPAADMTAVAPPPLSPVLPPPQKPCRPRKAPAAEPAAAPPPGTPAVTLATVTALEDAGELAAALEACTTLTREEPLNSGAHFHLARLQEELGVGDPLVPYRAALYLDPDFALASYHLGLACWRRGKLAPAQRCFRNARNAIARLDGDAPVAEGRGLTVQELNGMIALWLDGEEGGA
ncbi:chemotaxis protein methyltransferase CheR [Azospirillum fermentarium]|uniref:CheR family methyltransferase n=1 Tax=Azospirillum fermentarium TaxID=1233114 RepID=UPI0022270194|nr:protein-glutamate O-methyltransferase CheR [Azospirillum fermentarium]MCW2246656.1 chemotaxis protein methyltransferase CheR [Azospirillum fermentarium]